MKQFVVILKYELFSLFISPATYVASFYFLSLLALGFRFFIDSFVHTDWILPPISSLIVGLFFGAPALIPFITMRSFAEERKLGTLETLVSAPVSTAVLVLGKWMACYLFFLFISILAFCYPIILYIIFPEQGQNLGFHNLEQWIGCTFFLSSFGATFTAIGVLSSSLTKNQMVAGMLSFTILTIYISLMVFNFGKDDHSTQQNLTEDILSSVITLFDGIEKLEYFSVGIIEISMILQHLILTVFVLVLTTIQLKRIHQ